MDRRWKLGPDRLEVGVLKQLPFRLRLLAGLGVVALVGGSILAYQLVHRDPPSFGRGGVFAGGPVTGETTTTSALAAEPTTTSSSAPATTASTAAPATTATTAARATT